MTAATARQRAESQFRFLKQRVEQLEVAHAGNIRLAINDFCDFFVRDDVVALLSLALHQRLPVSAKSWHEQAQRESTVPPLPESAAGAMAFRFATLRLVRREKLDLRFFVSNLFPGAHLNARLESWKQLVVHPFTSDCRVVADALIARMSGEWVDLPPLIAAYLDGPFNAGEGFGPRAWGELDDKAFYAGFPGGHRPGLVLPDGQGAGAPEASASAPPAGDPFQRALEDLRRNLAQAPLSADARHDLLLDVDALELEGRRRQRLPERIRARLGELAAAAPGVQAACSAAERALHG